MKVKRAMLLAIATLMAITGSTVASPRNAIAAADDSFVAASSRAVSISTNYAWARGEVSWWGTDQAALYLKVHDTPQLTSNSWARVAYKIYYSGAWHQRYVQPEPFLAVGNGGTAERSYQIPGPVKDVWIDLCSKRNGTTYCTGWS